MFAQAVRYKDLKPDGMESNIFMYHLKQLIKRDFVAKYDNLYTLTPLGLQYVDSLDADDALKAQPKTVTVLYVTNQNDEVLVVKRKIQPFIDSYMLLSSKQHFGETTEEHIHKELAQKLSIEVPAATYCGAMDVLLYDEQSKTLLTHVIGQLYKVRVKNTPPPAVSDRYSYHWCKDITTLNTLPGTEEIVQNIQKHSQPFLFSYKNI